VADEDKQPKQQAAIWILRRTSSGDGQLLVMEYCRQSVERERRRLVFIVIRKCGVQFYLNMTIEIT
jgi:hypothetical protein